MTFRQTRSSFRSSWSSGFVWGFSTDTLAFDLCNLREVIVDCTDTIHCSRCDLTRTSPCKSFGIVVEPLGTLSAGIRKFLTPQTSLNECPCVPSLSPLSPENLANALFVVSRCLMKTQHTFTTRIEQLPRLLCVRQDMVRRDHTKNVIPMTFEKTLERDGEVRIYFCTLDKFFNSLSGFVSDRFTTSKVSLLTMDSVPSRDITSASL